MFRTTVGALLGGVMFGGVLSLGSFAAAAGESASAPTMFDVHLPVLGESLDKAVDANKALNKAMGSTAIDFAATHSPHVTLYLTAFSCPVDPSGNVSSCVHTMKWALSKLLAVPTVLAPPCTIELTEPYAAGSYAMMNVTDTACLQKASDTIVTALYKLAEPNQPAPGWVNGLPEPERTEKLNDIKKYGSPNVFGQFAPHVTLAWDEDPAKISAAIAATRIPPSSFRGDLIAIGTTGNHGTVLQHEDQAIYNISQPDPNGCKLGHHTPAGCNADHTTDGGCVWCRLVDVAFCTSVYDAKVNAPKAPNPLYTCDF